MGEEFGSLAAAPNCKNESSPGSTCFSVGSRIRLTDISLLPIANFLNAFFTAYSYLVQSQSRPKAVLVLHWQGKESWIFWLQHLGQELREWTSCPDQECRLFNIVPVLVPFPNSNPILVSLELCTGSLLCELFPDLLASQMGARHSGLWGW